ncbi:unnamed protein product, partial [Choristocarpus tenellus]
GTSVLVGRNPSLHPGDLRVLERVHVTALHHLKNVVVFPCQGDRPHPSEMSGGDLDGDMYFVIWDERFLPPEGQRHYPPMGYEPPPPPERKEGGVSVEDIEDFFLNYIMNDNLGIIANLHLAWADSSELGACSEECLELAKQHSLAVDFPKSGIPAKVPKELRRDNYPDFMPRLGGTKINYVSEKVLGRMYRSVVQISHTQAKVTEVLDHDMYVPGFEDFVDEAEVCSSWKD